MSVEDIIIYILLPVLAWILVHLIRLEKKVVILMVMLRDRGCRVPDKSDTDLFRKITKL